MNSDEARRYDKMINWKVRLDREIPVITRYLESGTVLDIACSSGRHSFALEEHGFTCIGIDVSETFIDIAMELKGEESYHSEFLCHSVIALDLRQQLSKFGIKYFDNAVMLGNAIANMGGREAGIALIRNIFLMLKPGGKFFVQTVIRPSSPHYLPLRKMDEGILQRIMVPKYGDEFSNIEFHINHLVGGDYKEREISNDFFMYTEEEFGALITDTGFEVIDKKGGYNDEEVVNTGGSTVIWMLKKPEIVISKETEELFSISNIRERILSVWQDIYQELQYYSIARYRFLHPRILSHPKYSEISLHKKRILDIGCGIGTDLEQMVLDGADPALLTGVDRSEIIMRIRSELFGPSEIEFIHGDISKDSYEDLKGNTIGLFDRQFDIVFSGSLLHLLTEETASLLLLKVYKILSEGGIFYGRFVGMIEDTDIDMGYYTHLYTVSGFRALLEKIGYRNIEIIINDGSVPACERSYGEMLTLSFYCER